MVQVFSCQFSENSKNTFFIEHLWWLLLGLNAWHGSGNASAKLAAWKSTRNKFHECVILGAIQKIFTNDFPRTACVPSALHYSPCSSQVCYNKGFLKATPLKKRLRHRFFPVSFAKFLWTALFQNSYWGLLLPLCYDFVKF